MVIERSCKEVSIAKSFTLPTKSLSFGELVLTEDSSKDDYRRKRKVKRQYYGRTFRPRTLQVEAKQRARESPFLGES